MPLSVRSSSALKVMLLFQVLGVDAPRRMVKIEAGITLTALNEVLDLHGLALPNLGSISWQSFAGMLRYAAGMCSV